jgi:AraC-like DNA-binding protein
MEGILYIGISQAFFAGLLIVTRKPRIMANQVLAAWFFLICIEMIIVLINTNLVQLYSIKVLPFTYGPLMYLYARLITTEKPVFRYQFLWHFLPFLLFFIVSMIFLNKPVMEGSKGFLIIDRFISLRIIYGVSFFISITTYSILTYAVIHRFQKELKTFLSYSTRLVALRWLIWISVCFYVGYVLMFIVGLVDIIHNIVPFDPYEISFLGLTLFAFVSGYYGVRQPSLFGEILKSETESAEAEVEIKYSRSGMKKKESELYKQKILTYMEEDKPYLNRELSIQHVSTTLHIPRHFITEVINTQLGKNFYLLINEYRVEEFKRRISSPEYKNLTILAAAYDSGFNSKSAFNTIFKELCGSTPSEYLRDLKEKN